MRSIIKAGFFWQFAGGFALGAAALVSLHPASATPGLAASISAQR